MYKLHFSISSFSLLFLDIIFNPKYYGRVNYRVISERGLTYAYLTKKGLRETYSLSKKLLSQSFSDALIKRMEKLNFQMSVYKMPKLTQANYLTEWGALVELLNEFMDIYRFCEQPFQLALEEKIITKCKNRNTIIKILHKPAIAKKLNFNNEEIYSLNLLIKLGKIKLELHKNAEFLIKALNIFGKFLAKKHNLSLNQALSLRKSEFNKSLKGRRPDIDLINKRIKGFALIPKKKKWFCYSGDEYLYWKKRIERDLPKIVKGDVAYRGKTTGKAVIHLDWTGIVNIPEGSVLVCGMTNPQIIPYLKNAKAIVTDEGGLTCHAAIISRELKIPCIVGTGNATKILKNGDLIKVDANKGVVEIIIK